MAASAPWQSDPARYGRAVLTGQKKPCDEALLHQLQDILDKRMEYLQADGGEEFFDAVQNARIVHAAEHYYRIMYEGSTESWNLRDRHMFDTLQQPLGAARQRQGRRLGAQLAYRQRCRDRDGLAGRVQYRRALPHGLSRTRRFSSASERIAARWLPPSDWDEPMEVKTVRPPGPTAMSGFFGMRASAAS